MREPQPLIEKACAQLGGLREYWSRYFRELTYNFGTDEQAGLSLYFDYAKRLGLLDREVRMQFFVDHTALQVNE
jgi:chorismate dehydratase